MPESDYDMMQLVAKRTAVLQGFDLCSIKDRHPSTYMQPWRGYGYSWTAGGNSRCCLALLLCMQETIRQQEWKIERLTKDNRALEASNCELRAQLEALKEENLQVRPKQNPEPCVLPAEIALDSAQGPHDSVAHPNCQARRILDLGAGCNGPCVAALWAGF